MNASKDASAPPVGDDYFLFLNMQLQAVARNMDVHDRISSTGFHAINTDVRCVTAYNDGSAQYAPFIRSPAASSEWTLNPNRIPGFQSLRSSWLCSDGRIEYPQEYEGETIRLEEFPLLPSRFSCVFTFKSLDDCERTQARFGWPRERIRSCKLAVWQHVRTARLSMDIASILLPATSGLGSDERKELWRLYWSGGSVRDIDSPTLRQQHDVRRSLEDGDIWECLIEGQLIVDRDSRY